MQRCYLDLAWWLTAANISQNKTQDGAGTSKRFVVDFLVIVTKFVVDGGTQSYLFYYYMLLYYGGPGCNSTVRSELNTRLRANQIAPSIFGSIIDH